MQTNELKFDKNELIEIVQVAVEATINKLIDKGLLIGSANSSASANANCGGRSRRANANSSAVAEKSAYQQTEALLYNYMNFKKIIKQKQQEIEDIQRYGVLQGGSAVVMYGNRSGTPQGIVLDEERKANAIKNIEKSMETTVQAIALIDSCMKTLVNDPYYAILEMRYFEGRTQEDIAVEFNCTQQNVSYQKSRLVKELSIKLFPDKVVNEYFN